MEIAYPPRFWWLKRLGPLTIFVLVLMFGSYWALGVWAANRVEQELAEWRKLPVVQPEDTGGTLADLADPGNPASHVQKALDSLTRHTPEQTIWNSEKHEWPPVSMEDIAVMRGFTLASGPALDALRQARSEEVDRQYQWALGPLSISTLLPNLNLMRDCGLRLGWAMLVAHHDEDLSGALEHARDIRELAKSCAVYGPCLVSVLVSCGLEHICSDRLVEIAGHAPYRTEEQELALWRASANDVRELIGEQLDHAYHRHLLEVGNSADWLVPLSVRGTVPAWAGTPRRTFFTAPMLDVNAARVMNDYRKMRAAALGGDSYPAQMQSLNLPQRRQVNNLAGFAAQQWFRDYPVAQDSERSLRALARTRVVCYIAGIALATRLFEADHGRLPATLEELVPEYLPRTPEDPFDAAGGPLRFALVEGLPVVWSVGPNGTDEGGSVRQPEGTGAESNFNEDYVFPLRFPESMNYKPIAWLRDRQDPSTQQGP